MLKIADSRPEVMEYCLKEVVQMYKDGKIKPQVGGEYPSNELAQAHAALESGKTTGKLAVVWE